MEQDLEDEVPEKLNPDIKSIRAIKRVKLEYLLDQDEVNRLIAASVEPYIYEPTKTNPNYLTYTREEVEAIMRDDYNPAKFNRRK